jgi:hypothetical protein
MRKFISYDPTKDLLTTTVEEDGKSHFAYEQDVEPYMDSAAYFRTNEKRDSAGIKEGFWHVGFIPDSIILKMRFEDGVNVYDKNQRNEVLKLLETKYPKFKTTNKRIA